MKHKVSFVSELPMCSFCKTTEARYDAKTRIGPWANMCLHCFEYYGIGLGEGLGQELVHEDLKPRSTFREDIPSVDELSDMIYHGVAEATDGCMVELDGTCPHGHPSWLIKLGYI